MITVLSLAIATVLTPAPGFPVTPEWSAGYEQGYADICDVPASERVTWATAVPTALPSMAFEQGRAAAGADMADYVRQGFDEMEYCWDLHP